HHAAVRDEGDGLPRMGRREARGRGNAALIELAQRLAAGRREIEIAPAPALASLRPAFLDFLPGVAFELAEVPLAQADLGDDLAAGAVGHGPRGVVGAQQVARVDGRDALFGHGLAEPPCLPAAGVVERDVELALDARVDVPRGLALADGDG